MVDSQSLSTFSGLFVFFAILALLNRYYTLGGLLLVVAGSAGLSGSPADRR